MIRRRLRTLEALLLTAAYMLAIRLLPLRWLLPSASASSGSAAEEQRESALAIRGAIRSAGARLSFTPSCLALSLAAHCMLARRDIPHRFHIGARRSPDFAAHAWVEACGLTVAGEGETHHYSVVMTR